MSNITEYSAIVVITLFLIKEMFSFLKSRKQNGSNYFEAILEELKFMNSNHFTSLEKAIRESGELAHKDHDKQIEILYQIKSNTEK